MTTFYYNPVQTYKDYEVAYLNGLSLLGIDQKPEDLKKTVLDVHPIEVIIRNASKFGFLLKEYKNIKSICASPGVIICKIDRVWHANDTSKRIFVNSLNGDVIYDGIIKDVDLIYKFVETTKTGFSKNK